MAAAQGKIAAEPLNEGGFLVAGALGTHHPVTQEIQLLLIAREMCIRDRIKTEMDSMPSEMDDLAHRITQLQIEQVSLKKETDAPVSYTHLPRQAACA